MIIPKIIWQTCSFKKDQIPEYIKVHADTWEHGNPNWEYKYFDDEDCNIFIKTYYPEYYDIYNSIKIPFVKSDFWRYFALHEFGGVYADIDTVCLSSLDDWLDPNKYFITSNNFIPELGYNYEQWAFATTPKNIFIKAIIDEMIKRINSSKQNNDMDINTYHTSPYMFTDALKGVTPHKDFLLMDPNFNNNILHLNGSNRWSDSQENKKLLHTHYWNKKQNVDIKITTNGYGSGVTK
jgi:inositol phosphorylceramide mannosyltransferase catalytic subunit